VVFSGLGFAFVDCSLLRTFALLLWIALCYARSLCFDGSFFDYVYTFFPCSGFSSSPPRRVDSFLAQLPAAENRLDGLLDCELVGRSSGTRSPAARPSDSPGARGASRGIASEAFGLPWCTWGESSDCGRGSPELEPAKIPLAGPIRGPLSAVSSRSASASSPPSLLAFFPTHHNRSISL
jgi:hypothetical protein